MEVLSTQDGWTRIQGQTNISSATAADNEAGTWEHATSLTLFGDGACTAPRWAE